MLEGYKLVEIADGIVLCLEEAEPDINASLAHATLELGSDSTGGVALRLGLAGVRHLGDAVADQIVAERQARAVREHR